MGSPWVALNLHEVYAKVIHYPPIYFYYVPWVYRVYSRKLKLMMISEVWLFVEMGLGFPIYFLQMIAHFFAALQKLSVKDYWMYWLSMRGF